MPSVTWKNESVDKHFDANNPFNLDYHGIDFAQSFQDDQQNYRNRKEYFIQKRAIDRINSKKAIWLHLRGEDRQQKLGLPKLFQAVENEIDGEKCEAQPALEKKYIVRAHEKPGNAAKIAAEYQRRHDRLTELAHKQMSKEGRPPDNEGQKRSAVLPPQIDRKYPRTHKNTMKFKRNVENAIRNHRQKVEAKIRTLNNAGISSDAQMNPEMFVDALMANANVYEEWSAASDDDDGLDVGLNAANHNRFDLRGIHFVPDIRGKSRASTKCEQTCMTRDEWLQSLLAEVMVKNKKRRNIPHQPIPAVQDENVSDSNYGAPLSKPTRRSVRKIQLAELVQNDVDEKYLSLSKFRLPAFDRSMKATEEEESDEIYPELYGISPDRMAPYRLDAPKTKSAQAFGARRHHDHCDPVEHKTVLVKYDVKIPANALDNTVHDPPQMNECAASITAPIPGRNCSSSTTPNKKYCDKIKETYLNILKRNTGLICGHLLNSFISFVSSLIWRAFCRV